MFGDLQNPRWLYAKAILLFCVGTLASVILIIESPTLRTAALLAIALWGFCRAYYFAFYVIEHYVDPGFKFAGLWAFARYAWTRSREVKK